jgi:hypothetical protein
LVVLLLWDWGFLNGSSRKKLNVGGAKPDAGVLSDECEPVSVYL